MTESRSYPAGVPSWIDTEQPDVEQALAFYAGLFGWTFTEATPPGVPFRYVVAQLDGRDVAGIGGPAEPGGSLVGSPAWNTYVAVDDVESAVIQVEAAGGLVLEAPADAGDGGRSAVCVDPENVQFRLWQAHGRPGAQVVNAPGSWNFSDLHAADPTASAAFYAEVFGWQVDDVGFGSMIRRPGYGDHLAATVDPEIHSRQAAVAAPPGFADAVGWLVASVDGDEPHWHASFAVGDRDTTAASVERLGGTVLTCADTDWTREALIRDPQGAVFTASQFTPPSG